MECDDVTGSGYPKWVRCGSSRPPNLLAQGDGSLYSGGASLYATYQSGTDYIFNFLRPVQPAP